MPVVKYPRATEPLWHEWDRKAQKCGLRHTVYAVNGDQYTGEWLDNLKHGKGTQLWKCSRAIYSGDWKFGKRDGYGSYSIFDPVAKEYKKVYTGWWKNDQKATGRRCTPVGSATRGSGARGCAAAGAGCTTRTAPSTTDSGCRTSPMGRGCCGCQTKIDTKEAGEMERSMAMGNSSTWIRDSYLKVELADPDGVLVEAQAMFDDSPN
ncbi:MORN repeat-containing protein 3 isoform X2 [Melanerpes formicivorus]|uniref:MORN repeat-containing protein 3 isoform X2 n=1 Tax=Melanerpes formicivorus TaxID=211600 RepID=UPI0035900BB0